MEIVTFRAKTMQEALNLVRQELGPEATVLHTRELNANLLGRMLGRRQVEIAASSQLSVPSQLLAEEPETANNEYGSHLDVSIGSHQEGLQELHSGLETTSSRLLERDTEYLDDELFSLYTDLIEADLEESIAQEYIGRLQERQADGIQAHQCRGAVGRVS